MAPFLSFDSGSFPVAVAIGDLNGDGKLDMVTSNQSSSTISVLLGNGDGSFGAKIDYATGGGPSSRPLPKPRRSYNGRFPCFFFGSSCRLFRSISNAAISFGRVSEGPITSSR